jgi:hypothetical protein
MEEILTGLAPGSLLASGILSTREAHQKMPSVFVVINV